MNTKRRMNTPMLLTLSLGHVVADIYGGMLPAMLPIFVSTFGLSYFAVALVSASHSFSASAIQPVLGYVSDRINGKLVLPLAPLVAAVGVTVATQAPVYGLVLIAVAIGGLGIAAYHPEGYKAAGYYSGDQQNTGTSIFSVGGNIGVAAGPLVVAVLYAWQAQRGLILMLIPGILMALVLWRLLPRIETGTEVAPPDFKAAFLDIRPVLKPFVLLLVIVILRSFFWVSLGTFIPLYAVAELDMTVPEAAAGLLPFLLFSGAIGTLIGGYVADRTSKEGLLLWSLAPVPLFVYVFLHTSGLWLPFMLVLIGGFTVSTFAVTVVMSHELLPKQRAMASGMMVGFAWGISGMGTPFVGIFADNFGLPAAFNVLMLAPLLPLALTLLYLRLMQRDGKYRARMAVRSSPTV